MTQDMLSFFNLSDIPFSKEIPVDKLLLLDSVKNNLEALRILINTKGIGILTGKSGSGKSQLIRLLLDSLNPGLYKPIYVCHSSVTINEFYMHVCADFGLEHSGRKAALYRKLKERIISLNNTSKIHPVIVIDEAHLLRNDILQELRLLLNFEIDSFNAVTLLLCGQETLLQKLGLTLLEPLANSISIFVKADSLPEDETYAYIESRLLASGNGNPIFTKNALKLIHQAAGGILRSINTIANAALFKAFTLKSSTVEAEHVRQCIAR